MSNPLPSAIENKSKNFWFWALAALVCFIAGLFLQHRMEDTYQGFWGRARADLNPVAVHHLQVWMQVAGVAACFCFCVTCYKAYWKWVRRVIRKHASEPQSGTN